MSCFQRSTSRRPSVERSRKSDSPRNPGGSDSSVGRRSSRSPAVGTYLGRYARLVVVKLQIGDSFGSFSNLAGQFANIRMVAACHKGLPASALAIPILDPLGIAL